MGQTDRADLHPQTDLQPAGDVPITPVPSNGSGSKQEKDRQPQARQPAPNKKPRRRIWPWIFLAALILLAYFGWRYFTKRTPPPKTAPAGTAITAAQSKTGDINIYIQALGTVTPTYTVTVYSQITGRVMNVYYHEGQMVQKGDALIDIDPRPYEATLAQAQGALEHDQGLLAEARIDLQRYQAAFAKNAIAKQQLDDQGQVVVQDQGTVKADQGTVDYDKTQLSYCHIVAPITGRVGLRLVDPGNTIFSGSSSTLVVITQLQPITVVFNVSEDDLPQVQAQLRGNHSLQVDAFDRADEKVIASGKLTSLDNEVDTTTGTVKFRAEYPNRNLSLFPNQFVNARLLLKTLRKATLVPTAAVQHNGEAAFVYLVKSDNTVAVQNVTVLTSNEQSTAVTGLNPGVNLATSGFDRLENGVAVVVRQPGQPNAKSAPGDSASKQKSNP